VICCETCPKTKSKLYRQLLVATGRQAVNTAHMHRQGLTVPSRRCIRRNSFHCSGLTRLMEKDRLIRSLWNQIQPRTIVFLNPSLPWNCISRDILECLLNASHWFARSCQNSLGQPPRRHLSIEIVRLADQSIRCPLNHRSDHKEALASLAVFQHSWRGFRRVGAAK
jgi:hypothetical protein